MDKQDYHVSTLNAIKPRLPNPTLLFLPPLHALMEPSLRDKSMLGGIRTEADIWADCVSVILDLLGTNSVTCDELVCSNARSASTFDNRRQLVKR